MTKVEVEILIRKLYKMSKGNNTAFHQLLWIEQQKIQTHTITCDVRKNEVFVLIRERNSARLRWEPLKVKI